MKVAVPLALFAFALGILTGIALKRCDEPIPAPVSVHVNPWKYRMAPPRTVQVEMPDGSIITTDARYIDCSWVRAQGHMAPEPMAEIPALPPAPPSVVTPSTLAPSRDAGAEPWLIGATGGYAGRWTGGLAVGYEWRRVWLMGQAGPGFGLATVGGRW